MVEATPTRLTPPHCSYGCQQSCVEILALPPLLFALQAELLFLVSVNSDKTHRHTHPQHAKISQKSQRPLAAITAHSQL